MDEYRKKIIKENAKKKKQDKTQLGINMVKYIIRNSKLVKEEVFTIVGIAQNRTFEEVGAQSIGKTLKTFKEIFQDKELVDFFKSAM